MAVMGMAVAGLRRLESLLPALRELGRRHAGYGVTDRHCDTVSVALLWAGSRPRVELHPGSASGLGVGL
jgi:hemoglobin-like flavoprotein